MPQRDSEKRTQKALANFAKSTENKTCHVATYFGAICTSFFYNLSKISDVWFWRDPMKSKTTRYPFFLSTEGAANIAENYSQKTLMYKGHLHARNWLFWTRIQFLCFDEVSNFEFVSVTRKASIFFSCFFPLSCEMLSLRKFEIRWRLFIMLFFAFLVFEVFVFVLILDLKEDMEGEILEWKHGERRVLVGRLGSSHGSLQLRVRWTSWIHTSCWSVRTGPLSPFLLSSLVFLCHSGSLQWKTDTLGNVLDCRNADIFFLSLLTRENWSQQFSIVRGDFLAGTTSGCITPGWMYTRWWHQNNTTWASILQALIHFKVGFSADPPSCLCFSFLRILRKFLQLALLSQPSDRVRGDRIVCLFWMIWLSVLELLGFFFLMFCCYLFETYDQKTNKQTKIVLCHCKNFNEAKSPELECLSLKHGKLNVSPFLFTPNAQDSEKDSKSFDLGFFFGFFFRQEQNKKKKRKDSMKTSTVKRSLKRNHSCTTSSKRGFRRRESGQVSLCGRNRLTMVFCGVFVRCPSPLVKSTWPVSLRFLFIWSARKNSRSLARQVNRRNGSGAETGCHTRFEFCNGHKKFRQPPPPHTHTLKPSAIKIIIWNVLRTQSIVFVGCFSPVHKNEKRSFGVHIGELYTHLAWQMPTMTCCRTCHCQFRTTSNAWNTWVTVCFTRRTYLTTMCGSFGLGPRS